MNQAEHMGAPLGERVSASETELRHMAASLREIHDDLNKLGADLRSSIVESARERIEDARRLDRLHRDMDGVKTRLVLVETKVNEMSAAITAVRSWRTAVGVAAATVATLFTAWATGILEQIMDLIERLRRTD